MGSVGCAAISLIAGEGAMAGTVGAGTGTVAAAVSAATACSTTGAGVAAASVIGSTCAAGASFAWTGACAASIESGSAGSGDCADGACGKAAASSSTLSVDGFAGCWASSVFLRRKKLNMEEKGLKSDVYVTTGGWTTGVARRGGLALEAPLPFMG